MVEENEAVDRLLSKWDRCTNLQKRQGRTWYLSAHDFALGLAFTYNKTLQYTAGIIAATSPRNKWADNKKDAQRVIEYAYYHQGSVDWDVLKLSSQTPKPETINRVLSGRNPDRSLGQKSKSFYRCIVNPLTDEVCVDHWAAKALGHTERWVSIEQYPQYQYYYQVAAEEASTIPSVFQATIWIFERGSHD